MDISRSLSFPSRNPNWLPSLLIWCLLAMGIVTTPLAVGYMIRMVRNVARGNEFFPSYADKGQLYLDGLRYMLACMVIALPIVLVMLGNAYYAHTLEEQQHCTAASILALLSSKAFGRMLQSVYLAISVFVMPLIMICVAYSPNWYAGLDFSLMRRFLSHNLWDYAFMVLVSYAISSLSGFGIFLLGVGVLITIPYACFTISHIYGSYLQESLPQDVVEN